ncbi:hypothetical protein O7620_00510 [Micromonospora sp. WMMD710]|nr:hypothetical protein [Micromonospora sp. WMMD710]MDG4756388.1 hypothetical protein [Micromonospora sp. WMMD710]
MFAARPVSVNVVAGGAPVTVPTFTPPRYTSYPRTPMLSVDAVHRSVTVVPAAVPVSCVGAVGACVSA